MLVAIDEAIRLIEEGKILHIAGDEALLSKLPKGKWIGGTTAFFITEEEGGIFTKDRLFVDEMDFAEDIKIEVYGRYNIFQFVEDGFDNGLNMIIMPAASDVLKKYAKDAPEIDELLLHPTIGWVSGYDTRSEGPALVYDGSTGECYTDRAVVMMLKLPEDKVASVNILNVFEDDKTDSVIRFDFDSLEVDTCRINGYEIKLSEFMEKKNIDPKMPLVADHNGSYINVAIKTVENGIVYLYAPVFRGVDYRFATEITDYEEEFKRRIEGIHSGKPIFSCNCILNYIYGNLEGKKTTPFEGPITFGEVAYQLMSQTLVYCVIE